MNVEFHGYGRYNVSTFKQIEEKLKSSCFANKIVITTYTNLVADLKNDIKIFIRVFATPDDDRVKLIALLQEFNEDIEVIDLAQWIPKK